jgi:hypothetical protein
MMTNRLGAGRVHVAAAVATLLAAGLGSTARAQELASFAAVPAKVKVGKTIRLTCTDGRKLEGKLVRLSPSSVGIQDSGLTVDVQVGEIRTIRRPGPKPWARDVLIGLGAGAAFGAMAFASTDRDHGCGFPFRSCTEAAFAGGAFFGGIGAGVGALFAAGGFGKEILVYERTPASPSARLSISPFVTPARQGVMFSVRF